MSKLQPGSYCLYFGSQDDEVVWNVEDVGLVGTPTKDKNFTKFNFEYAYGTDFAYWIYFDDRKQVVTNNAKVGLAGSPASQKGTLFFPRWDAKTSRYRLYMDDLRQVVTNNAKIGLAGSPGSPGTGPVGVMFDIKSPPKPCGS